MKKLIYTLILLFGLQVNVDAQNQLSRNLPRLDESILLRSSVATDTPVDYTKGVFFVNEDWFGHNNSTINFLSDDGTWIYRIFRRENPGHELGCTTQYGTIYGGKFYLVSKQNQDPGSSVSGSRLAVCDAKTMKLIKEFRYFGQDSGGTSIADGRSFLGVDEHKGYIGTSNGIFIFDIDNMSIGSQIQGTTNNSGSLYTAQVGTMIRAANKVFAVHQKEGLIIIDPVKDKVISTIQAPKEKVNGKDVQRGFGSIVQSKDGNLWLSMTADQSGSGTACQYMLRLDPWTQDTTRINLPEGMDIPNSWYAWTADGFFASTAQNKLYWKNNGGWFHSTRIICYDIDKGEASEFFQTQTIDKKKDWAIYGAAVRIHPVTDEIYTSLFQQFNNPEYITGRISNDGKLQQTYPMITNYWFPAMPVFPDIYSPEIELSDLTVFGDTVIALNNKVLDKDNTSVSMIKSLLGVDNTLMDASIDRDSLRITPKATNAKTKLTLKVNSNGKLVEKDIAITIIKLSVPTITKQPVSITKYYGESASFSVVAQGGLLSYQWYKNGTVIEGAKEAVYRIDSAVLNEASQGEYHCEIINSKGTVSSEKAKLSVAGNILSKVMINSEEWSVDKTYLVSQNSTASELTVELQPVNSNIEVYYGDQLLEDNIYRIAINKPVHKTYPFTLKSNSGFSAQYNITVEKRFDFDNIVVTRWDNTLLVNGNNTTNGGFDFIGYKWFKDGNQIGTGQYYSAGSKKTDVLNGVYYIQLTTSDGQEVRSWEKTIKSFKSMLMKAYPNPLRAGEAVSVQLDIDQELLDKAMIEIYNINGIILKKIRATGAITPVIMPDLPGMYILKVNTGTFIKEEKLIVK